MKIVKVIVISFVVLVSILVIGTFIAYKTIDINRFKSTISGEISNSIGADVSIENIRWSLSLNGIFLDVKGLSVDKFALDGNHILIEVEEALFNADILAFLLRKEIVFSNVEIISPVLTIQKSEVVDNSSVFYEAKDGDMPVESLSNIPDNSHEGINKEVIDMTVNSISLEHGVVHYIDGTMINPIDIAVNDINIQISNLAFDEDVSFKFSAAVLSRHENVSFTGMLIVSRNNQQIRIDDIVTTLNLVTLDFKQIKDIIPGIEEFTSTEQLKGQIKVILSQIIAGFSGVEVLSVDVELSDAAFELKEPKIYIDNIDIKSEITETDINISEIFAYVGQGMIRGKSRVGEYGGAREVSFNADFEGININDMFGKTDIPFDIEGELLGSFDIKGSLLDLQKWQDNLEGDVFISLKDGKLLDVNILEIVLDKISIIPNLSENVYAKLPEKYKKQLLEKNTSINKFEVDGRARGGNVFINTAEIESDGFIFSANGKMDFNGNINLGRSSFYIPKDLSESMVKSSEDLQYFLNKSGQIVIPFKSYSGAVSEIIIYPDIEGISKVILKNRGKQELRKVLFKALDIDDEQLLGDEKSSLETQNSEGDVSPQKRPEEVLIENVLDGLFNSILK